MKKLICLMAICVLATGANAQNHNHHQHHKMAKLPDDVAPAGIGGDHSHLKGSLMASYSYGRMEMSGIRHGTNDISRSEALSSFMMAPKEMNMEMHMLGFMYGVSDEFTIMAMAPYVRKSMTMVNRMGMDVTSKTQGLGDFKLSSVYNIYDSNEGMGGHSHRSKHKVIANFGVNLPTGSISQRNGAGMKLGYPMQLGSGTFDPTFGISYQNKNDNWSWGAKADAVIRLGKNNDGYRLGNEYVATSWASRNITDKIGVSARIEGKSWGNIHGADRELNRMISPSNRADMRGGERADIFVGVNSVILGKRFVVEFGQPVYQDLEGIQGKTDYTLKASFKMSF